MIKAISALKSTLIHMHSENWGGIASLAGSLVVLAAGDVESFVSTGAFFAAEGIFAFKGHKSWGYSLGCSLIGTGNGFLLASKATAGNPSLQVIMGTLAATWLIGGLRYPLEMVSTGLSRRAPETGKRLLKISEQIPPWVGTAALIQRFPALISAGVNGSYVMLAANSLWGTSDILLGRIQDLVKGPVKSFLTRFKKF